MRKLRRHLKASKHTRAPRLPGPPAAALDAAGDPQAFRREAAAALHLDQQTPHADKKLPADLRAHLLRRGS